MTQQKPPRVAVVVLNWNRGADTIECLQSVVRMDAHDFFPVLVDNGSTDTSLREIRAQFPDIAVVENQENLGFAEGNNRGIQQALSLGADFVLILNNDVVADEALVRHLLDAAEAHPEAGVFGARVYEYASPEVIQYGGAEWQNKIGYFSIIDQQGTADDSTVEGVTPTPWACGCAFLARAEVFAEIGLLDPRFYLLWEEIDWCYRARNGGFEVMLVPEAKVWHKGSQSFGGGQFGPLWSYYHWRNRMLWVEREFGLWKRWYFYGRAVLPQVRHRVLSAISPRRAPERCKVARAELLGLAHYFLRRFGPAPSSLKS